jgi:hypothetical protein
MRGVDVVGVLLVLVLPMLLMLMLTLLLLLELVMVLLGAGGDVGVLFGEDTYDAGGDFVVDDRLVVLSDDVDSEFLHLFWGERRDIE